MTDAFGQKLEIGDTVAFNPPRYKGLAVGTIVAFTPKMVKIRMPSDAYGGLEQPDGTLTTVTEPRNVAKFVKAA